MGVNLSHVQAYIGGPAEVACQNIGAAAFAIGNNIAFGKQPGIELATHEATHTVQQKSGKVHLPGGVGHVGDEYETHADQVAATVARGESAVPLMADYIDATTQPALQGSANFQPNQEQEHTHTSSPNLFHNSPQQSNDYNQDKQAKFQANKHHHEEGIQGQELIGHNLTDVVQQGGGIQAKLIQNTLVSRSFRHLKIHSLESLWDRGYKMGVVKWRKLQDTNNIHNPNTQSFAVQQSSILDSVQMKCSECNNEDNLQQQSQRESKTHEDDKLSGKGQELIAHNLTPVVEQNDDILPKPIQSTPEKLLSKIEGEEQQPEALFLQRQVTIPQSVAIPSLLEQIGASAEDVFETIGLGSKAIGAGAGLLIPGSLLNPYPTANDDIDPATGHQRTFNQSQKKKPKNNVPRIPETSIPVPASKKRSPNQTCSDERIKELEKEMHEICDKGFSCNDKIENLGKKNQNLLSKEKLLENIARSRSCLQKRLQIQEECFNNTPDENHKKAIEDTKKALEICIKKYVDRHGSLP